MLDTLAATWVSVCYLTLCERSTRFFLLRVWYCVIFRGLLRKSTTLSVFPDFHPGKVPFSATNGCSFDRQAWMIFPSKLKSSKPVKVICFLSHYFSNLAAPPQIPWFHHQVREAIKRNGGWTDPAPRWEFPPADSIWQGLLKWCCSSLLYILLKIPYERGWFFLGCFSVNKLHHFNI